MTWRQKLFACADLWGSKGARASWQSVGAQQQQQQQEEEEQQQQQQGLQRVVGDRAELDRAS